MTIFDPRMPEPMITGPAAATRASTSTGQSAGSPIGVIPPYSMPVRSTATSIGANDTLRTSIRRRITPFTSARVVARMTAAAQRSTPSRFPVTTTQFADAAIGTDTPGQAPAAEKGFTVGAGAPAYLAEQDKYGVTVSYIRTEGGWMWKVFGPTERGSLRELASSGYGEGDLLPTKAAALAGPFVVDGRELDRAEYVLVVHG